MNCIFCEPLDKVYIYKKVFGTKIGCCSEHWGNVYEKAIYSHIKICNKGCKIESVTVTVACNDGELLMERWARSIRDKI